MGIYKKIEKDETEKRRTIAMWITIAIGLAISFFLIKQIWFLVVWIIVMFIVFKAIPRKITTTYEPTDEYIIK